jgi:quercetin dioxygenase-like cupin family protein
MRLEPGSVVALHRHTGELHAFTITGTREILGTGELVGAGNYVYEPAGTVDTWGATQDGPCVVHLKVSGAIEYLGPDGEITGTVSAATQRAIYLDWCQREGVVPDPRILG